MGIFGNATKNTTSDDPTAALGKVPSGNHTQVEDAESFRTMGTMSDALVHGSGNEWWLASIVAGIGFLLVVTVGLRRGGGRRAMGWRAVLGWTFTSLAVATTIWCDVMNFFGSAVVGYDGVDPRAEGIVYGASCLMRVPLSLCVPFVAEVKEGERSQKNYVKVGFLDPREKLSGDDDDGEKAKLLASHCIELVLALVAEWVGLVGIGMAIDKDTALAMGWLPFLVSFIFFLFASKNHSCGMPQLKLLYEAMGAIAPALLRQGPGLDSLLALPEIMTGLGIPLASLISECFL